MQIVYKKISELKPAEYNPRQLTEDEHQQITASIKEFGLIDPIIVNCHCDRENIIVGGHARVRIAKEMGMDSVPCVLVALNLEDERRCNLRLNRNVGSWDWDLLSSNFSIEELTAVGFTEAELELGTESDDHTSDHEAEPEKQNVVCPECGHKFEVFTIKKSK